MIAQHSPNIGSEHAELMDKTGFSSMPETNAAQPYSLLILAGGQGRRMQGKDKGLLDWQGRPLIAHIVDALAENAHEVLVSCNRNSDRYRDYGRPLPDTLPDFPGPLAGILAGLEGASHAQVLVVPCDNPCPPTDLYQRLSEQSSNAIRFAFDGEQDQVLYALIPVNLRASLHGYLQRGRRSVKGWFEQCHAERVDFSDQAERFKNMNRPSDAGRSNS